MSTITLKDINRKIKESEPLFEVIHAQDFEVNLKDLNVSWETGSVNTESKLFEIFVEHGFINKGENKLNSVGLLFCARISIDFEFQIYSKELLDKKFKIIRTISIGKNSCTFLAQHIILGTHVVLKFLRPGAGYSGTPDQPIP